MKRIGMAVSLLLGLAAGAHAGPLPETPYVSTSAAAIAEQAPDYALIQMQFRTVAESAEAARSATDKAQRALLGVLEDHAEAIRERRLESLTFGEAFEYDPRQQRQVRAVFYGRFSVRLEIGALERLADLHHALAGLEWESLGNPEFRVDDPHALEQRARQQALETARDRARNLAEAAGASLGPVWGVVHEPMHELAGRFSAGMSAPMMSRASIEAADSGFALPVEPVPVRFEARVGVVYTLEPAD